MAQVTEAMLVDKRIVERNIKKGLVSKAEYQAHLASLPDRADSLELVSVESHEEQPEAQQEPAPALEPAPVFE